MTVKNGTRLELCRIKPISSNRNFARSFSFLPLKVLPLMNTSPLDGACKPPAMVKKVLLPDPDGPIMATNSPFLTEKSVHFNASMISSPSLKDFVTFLNSIAFLSYSCLPNRF